MKRLCSLLLAVLLIVSLGCQHPPIPTSCVGVPYEKPESTEHAHTALSFSELTADISDLDLTIARTRELLYRIERREVTGEAAQRLLEDRLDAYRHFRSAASLAYVHYCFDVTNLAQKETYDRLTASLNTLVCLLIDAELALSEDPALSDVYDEATVAQIRRSDALQDLSIQPLLEREQALVGAYDALETLTVSDGNRTWTREEILTDPTLDYETFSTLFRAYRSAYNEQAGGMFLELIDVRKEMAKTLGFDSYAAYGYQTYRRDYTPDEARMLCACVKSELVPLFLEMQEAFFDTSMRLTCGTFREEPTMHAVETAIANLLPELMEPWRYMTEHGMYSFEASDDRMSGSFTTYFESFGAPFLFTTWDDSYEMPSTLLHEFGHYAGYYLNGVQRMESEDALDLAEIDSQGLELLAFSQYDLLYGALADAARIANLTIALYAVITGCMEDEFQRFAYSNTVTLDTLNAEYERLAKEYGLYEMGLSGESWSEISHTFRAPMYYISYATSMLAALQLWVLAKHDEPQAKNAYRSILMRPIGATFRTTLNQSGLGDPFNAETVAALAKEIRADFGN